MPRCEPALWFKGLTLIALVASAALLFLSISKSCFLQQYIAPKLFKNSSKRQRMLWSLLADLPATGLLFIVGISIAPQIFYTYYLSLFPDLPLQWVLKPMSSVNEWLEHLQTKPDQSMAQHATTILFWTLILSTLLNSLFHGLLSASCSTARNS